MVLVSSTGERRAVAAAIEVGEGDEVAASLNP